MYGPPRGLFYYQDAIPDCEDELLEHFAHEEWFAVGACAQSRKVIHYGRKYNYGSQKAGAEAPPIPYIVDHLRQSLIATVEYLIAKGDIAPCGLAFDQCIVNKYEPGQGIGAHCDSKDFGGVIGCFTLLVGEGANTCEMKFNHPNAPSYVVPTGHGSLYIMSGESRDVWEHEMIARKTEVINGKRQPRKTRISITFRTVI